MIARFLMWFRTRKALHATLSNYKAVIEADEGTIKALYATIDTQNEELGMHRRMQQRLNAMMIATIPRRTPDE